MILISGSALEFRQSHLTTRLPRTLRLVFWRGGPELNQSMVPVFGLDWNSGMPAPWRCGGGVGAGVGWDKSTRSARRGSRRVPVTPAPFWCFGFSTTLRVRRTCGSMILLLESSGADSRSIHQCRSKCCGRGYCI